MTDVVEERQAAAETPPHPSDSAFRHLHPSSVLLKAAATAGQNLVALLVLHFSVFDQNPYYTAAAAMLLFALIIGWALLMWSRFTYHVGATEIQIKSGLLSRNNRSIPFDRIQDVSLERKLVSRILGLATVKLETGGSAGDEDLLDALALNDARALRDAIRDYKSAAMQASAPASDPATDIVDAEERLPVYAMNNRRIFIAGLFNFSFILLAILAALAQNLDFLLPDEYFNPWYWAEEFSQQEMINGLSLTARILGVVGAIMSLVLVGLVSGIVRTFIREYGFRLDRVDAGQPGYRRRRGLFTLTDMVMPIHRIQTGIIASGPVREHYGWHHLKFQSLASDGSGESDHSVAPCAMLSEIEPILRNANLAPPPEQLEFSGVHPAMWWRGALFTLLLLTAAGLAGANFLHPGLIALPLLALPSGLLRFLAWRRHGYSLHDDQLIVRTGWWRRRLAIVPRRKIQTIDVIQTPSDHPLDLGNLIIGIAGGSPMAPLRIRALRRDEALDLRQRLLDRVPQKAA